MAHHCSPASREPARRGGGDAYWSVEAGSWSSVRPGLPAHLVELLAPPIVVGVGSAAAPASHARPTGRRAGGGNVAPTGRRAGGGNVTPAGTGRR